MHPGPRTGNMGSGVSKGSSSTTRSSKDIIDQLDLDTFTGLCTTFESRRRDGEKDEESLKQVILEMKNLFHDLVGVEPERSNETSNLCPKKYKLLCTEFEKHWKCGDENANTVMGTMPNIKNVFCKLVDLDCQTLNEEDTDQVFQSQKTGLIALRDGTGFSKWSKSKAGWSELESFKKTVGLVRTKAKQMNQHLI